MPAINSSLQPLGGGALYSVAGGDARPEGWDGAHGEPPAAE
jgi:hypothetical protein